MHPAKYSELRGQIENLSGELLRGAMFGEGRFGDGNGGLLLPVLKALSPPLSGFRDGGPVKVGGALYGHTYLSGEAILRPQSLFTGKDIA